MATKKTDKAQIKQAEDQLRKVLTPFAEWAWGNPETAKLVIDKYFRQKPLKA